MAPYTRRRQHAHDAAIDLLLQRRAEDDRALGEALSMAAKNEDNDGAHRLRKWASEAYTR